MAFRPTTTSEAAKLNGFKFLVYGLPGAGKTVLCSTAGDHEKTLIISCEGGLLSLRQFDIPVAEVNSMAELREVYEYLAAGDHPFEWVCLDSISEIAEVVLSNEKEANKDPRKAYGALADIMFKLIRSFRDLPLNIYFSAKQGSHADEESGRTYFQPLMPGKQLTQGIAHLFDEVFVLRVERDEDGNPARWLQTATDGRYQAKDRSGSLDAYEPPDLIHIYNKIMKETNNG